MATNRTEPRSGTVIGKLLICTAAATATVGAASADRSLDRAERDASLSAAPQIASSGVDCEWDQSIGQPGMNGDVGGLGVYQGDLIAGGLFTHAGGNLVNFIARWDGSDWHSIGGGLDAFAFPIIEYQGDLIAGGAFTFAGGVAANRIARWDGTQWHPLGSGMNDIVWSIVEFEGDLIAGGQFTEAGGVTVNRVARWDGQA